MELTFDKNFVGNLSFSLSLVFYLENWQVIFALKIIIIVMGLFKFSYHI